MPEPAKTDETLPRLALGPDSSLCRHRHSDIAAIGHTFRTAGLRCSIPMMPIERFSMPATDPDIVPAATEQKGYDETGHRPEHIIEEADAFTRSRRRATIPTTPRHNDPLGAANHRTFVKPMC